MSGILHLSSTLWPNGSKNPNFSLTLVSIDKNAIKKITAYFYA